MPVTAGVPTCTDGALGVAGSAGAVSGDGAGSDGAGSAGAGSGVVGSAGTGSGRDGAGTVGVGRTSANPACAARHAAAAPATTAAHRAILPASISLITALGPFRLRAECKSVAAPKADYYDLLGVSREDDADSVREAFRVAARD